MALFGTDWRDPGQYALVLNMAQMSSAAAVNVIVQAAKLLDFQATAASRQTLRDLALAAKVEAHFLTYPRLRDLSIDVRAMDGEIILSGILPRSVSEQEVRETVEAIAGVKKVQADFVLIPSRVLRYG
jgi:osmotically-inducible protein OsmY